MSEESKNYKIGEPIDPIYQFSQNFKKGEELRRNNPAAKEYEQATRQMIQATLWYDLIHLV